MCLLWSSGFVYLRHERSTMERMYLANQTTILNMAWQAVVKSHKTGMQVYFDTYIMQPRVLELLRAAQRGGESDQAVQRVRLYRYLYPIYQKLRERDVRQLHFHTPDSRSFLRFHSPNRFGDSLTGIRPSVAMANRDHKYIQGFETGRMLSGFRNVFPILDSDEDLGSVEISQPFESLRREIWHLDKSNDFMLVYKASLLLPKLFEEQEKTYESSLFSQDWLVEDPRRELPDSPPKMSDSAQKVYAGLAESQSFLQAMSQHQPQSIAVKSQDGFYKVTIIPLEDVEGLVTAVLLSFSAAHEIDKMYWNYRIDLLIFSIMVLFGAISFLLFLQSKQNVVEKQRNIQSIANTMNDGLYVMNNKGVITFVNATASEILGYPRHELLGQEAHSLFHLQENSNCSLSECPIFNVLLTNTNYTGEEVFRRKDGSSFVAEVSSEPMFKKEKIVSAVTIFRDITKRKKMEEQLFHLCNVDPLTNAFNRRYFLQILEIEVQKAKRYGTQFVLAMGDIDHFKKVNDTFGHEAGDRVLKEIVASIHERIRSVDVFARWGGEEFVLLLANISLPVAVPLVENILANIRLLDFGEVGLVTVSFGVTDYHQEDTIDILLNRADRLLYEAKGAGRNCIRASG
ncbi:MAG: diguanylate cyclase [Desulfocapsaceae bacterium]|nr:diguanylate cyclase [Desulfocapsaceae bacterium]